MANKIQFIANFISKEQHLSFCKNILKSYLIEKNTLIL